VPEVVNPELWWDEPDRPRRRRERSLVPVCDAERPTCCVREHESGAPHGRQVLPEEGSQEPCQYDRPGGVRLRCPDDDAATDLGDGLGYPDSPPQRVDRFDSERRSLPEPDRAST
jgi:hypothetical protein